MKLKAKTLGIILGTVLGTLRHGMEMFVFWSTRRIPPPVNMTTAPNTKCSRSSSLEAESETGITVHLIHDTGKIYKGGMEEWQEKKPRCRFSVYLFLCSLFQETLEHKEHHRVVPPWAGAWALSPPDLPIISCGLPLVGDGSARKCTSQAFLDEVHPRPGTGTSLGCWQPTLTAVADRHPVPIKGIWMALTVPTTWSKCHVPGTVQVRNKDITLGHDKHGPRVSPHAGIYPRLAIMTWTVMG